MARCWGGDNAAPVSEADIRLACLRLARLANAPLSWVLALPVREFVSWSWEAARLRDCEFNDWAARILPLLKG